MGYCCKTFVPPDVGKQYHHILVVGRLLLTSSWFRHCKVHCNCSNVSNLRLCSWLFRQHAKDHDYGDDEHGHYDIFPPDRSGVSVKAVPSLSTVRFGHWLITTINNCRWEYVIEGICLPAMIVILVMSVMMMMMVVMVVIMIMQLMIFPFFPCLHRKS